MLKLLIIALLSSASATTSIYSYSFMDINGNTVHLSDFRGKKILFVNTASHSRYADQYATLEQLYQQNKDNLVVIAFPSNDFGHEPDTSLQVIRNSVYGAYSIHFLLAAPVSVKGGGADSLYQWLTQESLNGMKYNDVYDDFYKYLIDGSGNWQGVFAGAVDPMDTDLQNAIKN